MTHRFQSTRLRQVTGTILLWAAGILAVLIFVDRWTTVSLNVLPRFWYTTRSFHVLACIGLCVLGWLSHRHATAMLQQNDRTSPVFQTMTVYTKAGCPLCDQALDVLSEYRQQLPEFRTINISGNAELEAQHAESVPVVTIDGRIRFRGVVSAELLERMIDAQQRRLHEEQGRAVS